MKARLAIAFGGGQAYVVGRAEAYKGNSGSYNKYIGRFVIGRGYREIVNPSSTWSASTDKGKGFYGVAKAAISNMTAAFANQCGPMGVRVEAIASIAEPAQNRIRSPQRNQEIAKPMLGRSKLGRSAQPSDNVGAVVSLASPASEFLTGPTYLLTADGAQALAGVGCAEVPGQAGAGLAVP